MLQSMTGYGKSGCELENKKISIEIKTLNSKQIDINTRISGFFKEKEIDIRNMLVTELIRGKIDLSINVEVTGETDSVQLNEPVIKAYINQIKKLEKECDIKNTDILKAVLHLPNATKINIKELDKKEWEIVSRLLADAIEDVKQFRIQEGKAIEKDIVMRLGKIVELLRKIDVPEKKRIEDIKNRIHNNMLEYFDKEQIDTNRFEQELIYYTEKLDITEEKVRLKNHCDYFLATTKEKQSGKKLIFISQEMWREINTLGAKANNTEIQNIVIQMKDELEKIKEQLFNVL